MRPKRKCKIYWLLLALCVLQSFAFSSCDVNKEPQVSNTESSFSIEEESSMGESAQTPTRTRVAYIPLDNRPVNKDRVEYLAQSIDIELVMPEEELYRTALDNMKPNSDGSTIGNREKLLEWVRQADSECDYFIISLDQMFSGGLVGSRWLSNTDLTFEYEVADAIIELCKHNTVFLFDTVMRLASTVDYQGYDLDTYNTLRSYGKEERKVLVGDELTVENIIAGYRYDQNGNKVSTSLSEQTLEQYHASRARKLILADYILRNAGDSIEFIYVGVDDSSPQNTIQTNEINYLTALIGERGVLSAAADELGMCCLARLASVLYGEVEIGLTYYGPGENLAADSFDIATLGENVGTHLICLKAIETESKTDGLQVLILTRESSYSDCKSLLDQIKYNQQNNTPTVVLDVSGQADVLGARLFGDANIDVTKLFGYSSWNTAGNAMGIALSQGIARYAYLNYAEESSAEADAGFLKSLTFAYIKDLSYKRFHYDLDGFTTDDYVCSVSKVIGKMNKGRIVTALQTYTEAEHGRVSVFNFRYPWNRKFEMTFDIKVS